MGRANKVTGWVRGLPLRKLLALALTVISLPMIVISFAINRDIPPNTATLLTALCTGGLLGYMGSSAYEAVRKEQQHEEDETQA